MNKRILVLNYEFPPIWGWGSPASYEITKQYAALWYHVDVITMAFKWLPKYEIKDGIHIHRVPSLRSKKQVCHPWEQLTYLFFWYQKAKKLLKKDSYDVCHTHFIIPTWVLARKLKKQYNLDYIITAHGSDVLWYNPRFEKLYKVLEKPWKKIIDNCKYLVSPSEYLKKDIESIYGESDKIVVIPNGISHGKFKPLKKEKYILTVSRRVYAKGLQDLIESVKDIDMWDWKIKIVWEGPMEWELKTITKKYWLESNIEFLWWVDNSSDQMRELYGKASIFCQPSHFENMSIVLLESMEAGCCVVAKDVGGNKEVIHNDGLYSKNEELWPKIKELISNKEKRKSIWDENIKRVKTFYSTNVTERYLDKLYN